MNHPSRSFRRSCRFPSNLSAIPLFEDWIEAADFPDGTLRNRVKLAGEEVLDNLIRHAAPLSAGLIWARLGISGRNATLSFRFRSAAFRDFARSGGKPRAVYDSRDGRWRGLGLFMIASLSARVRCRCGWILDRVDAEF